VAFSKRLHGFLTPTGAFCLWRENDGTRTTLGYKTRGSEFVDLSFRRKPESRRFRTWTLKRTWMPAFAGMTNSRFAWRREISTISEKRDI